MKEFSNGMIAALLLVAMVISVFGVLTIINFGKPVSITGAAGTALGSANVSITGVVAIELMSGRNVTNFGVGVLDGAERVLTTKQDNYGATAWNFTDGTEGNGTNYGTCNNVVSNCSYPLVVVNSGSVNCSITLTASQTAAAFIGGSDSTPAQAFLAKENETGSCGKNMTGGGGYGERAWVPLTTSATPFCDQFDWNAAKDEIRIHINITIPRDASGVKANLLTLAAASGL